MGKGNHCLLGWLLMDNPFNRYLMKRMLWCRLECRFEQEVGILDVIFEGDDIYKEFFIFVFFYFYFLFFENTFIFLFKNSLCDFTFLIIIIINFMVIINDSLN